MSTLADYLMGDKAGSGFAGFYGQGPTSAYSLLADAAGKTKVPTKADLDAAQKPEDKLKLLRQMADVVSVQADAAIATGRAEALPGMTQSAKDVLTALADVVAGIKDADGKVPKDYAGAVGDALTSLRAGMDKIATLTGRAGADTASAVTSDLSVIDDRATTLANAAGTTWRRTGTTFRADPTKLVDILV